MSASTERHNVLCAEVKIGNFMRIFEKIYGYLMRAHEVFCIKQHMTGYFAKKQHMTPSFSNSRWMQMHPLAHPPLPAPMFLQRVGHGYWQTAMYFHSQKWSLHLPSSALIPMQSCMPKMSFGCPLFHGNGSGIVFLDVAHCQLPPSVRRASVWK